MKNEIIVFGGGCFWCTEAVFTQLRGVVSVTSGYAGGLAENPTYEEVTSGRTGHAEVIKIEFEPEQIDLNDLLTVFFATHDPTTMNQQGSDVGTQYRSIILYMSPEQQKKAQEFIEKIDDDFDKPIVTQVRPLDRFYPAEEYHRRYYELNPDKPYCQVVISPKLEKLQKQFSALLKSHGK